MKNTKLLTTVILICLIVFGAFALLLADDDGGKQEYDTAVSQAEEYMKRELYQMAIAEYDKAIAIKDSEDLRDAVLDAYEKRYSESTTIIDDYTVAAESAVSAYPKNANYYIILTKVYARNDNYQSAYKTLKNAIDGGVKSEEISKLYIEVKYAFETKWFSYSDIMPCVSGMYPVMNSELWGYVDETGDGDSRLDYSFISQLGDEGIRIMISEQNLLVDENDVVRGKLKFVPTQAGTYSEGFIAIHNGKNFGYYNSLGDYKFGEYLNASDFQNGKAAVCIKENEWSFIDTTGKSATDTKFEDIIINHDGSYRVNGVMIAKKDGKYHLYDDNNKVIGKFSCDAVDVLTKSGVFAFESSGKWGYANTSGEVIIEPKFDSAKSFSEGLAAVCKDEKWGFIDEDGNVVIDYQFVDADYFNSERYCFVKTTPGTWQMIQLKVKF